MTKKERVFPRILDASRKKRIAQGAGVTVADINILLERFEQSQQYVKLLKKFGGLPGLFK
jgi:signal recognition particle subunit SRP54